MADEEHLKILKKGVKVWNKWREENINNTPDLLGATLSKATLSKANLCGACLNDSTLRRATLARADLTEATLARADLSVANLSEATLSEADLREATLWRACLREADLRRSDLCKADLREADLRGADLRVACLNEANLCGAHLRGADLRGANLIQADLRGADFSEADLCKANLRGAYLNNANLRNSKLTNCICVNTEFTDVDLEHADLTGIIFKRTVTFGWNIEGVTCDYIFLDEERNKRQPEYRDFEPGEFEDFYQSLPTMEFVFKHGMKWFDVLIMDRIDKEFQTEKPELGMKLLSIDGRGKNPRAVFSVASDGMCDTALKELISQYEEKVHMLKNHNNQLFLLALQSRDEPRTQITTGGEVHDVIAPQGDCIINNITINQTIEKIKEIAEKEPEASFTDKSKKKFLEILDEALMDAGTDALKKAAGNIIKLVGAESASLALKMAAEIAILQAFLN